MDSHEKVVVGINKFRNKEESGAPELKIDEDSINKQLHRLKQFKQEREIEIINKSLQDLKKAARNNNENLIPYIIKSIKKRATLGEISDALREIYGEHF